MTPVLPTVSSGTPPIQANTSDPTDNEHTGAWLIWNMPRIPAVFGCAELYQSGRIALQCRSQAGQTGRICVKCVLFPRYPGNPADPYHTTERSAKCVRPATFIVAQDHVEPKIEGSRTPTGADDMMYIQGTNKINLTHYRPAAAGGKGGRGKILLDDLPPQQTKSRPGRTRRRSPSGSRKSTGIPTAWPMSSGSTAMRTLSARPPASKINLSCYTGKE